MASMTLWKNGIYRVFWRVNGIQHNKYLPKAEAKKLYDKVCGLKLFETLGISENVVAHSEKADAYKTLSFQELADRYVKEHLLYTRAPNNQSFVKILVRKWGEYKLCQIKIIEFRKWMKFALTNQIPTCKKGVWKDTQLKAESVNKLERYMRRIFTWAIEEEIISLTPFIGRVKNAELRKEFNRRKKFKPVKLSVEEFLDMVNTFPSYVKRPSMMSYFCGGLRLSEIIKCSWSNLNRNKHCISFDADDVKEASGNNSDGTKVVYYDPELEPMLEEMGMERIVNGYKDDYMFRNEKGYPLSYHSCQDSITHYAHKYAKTSGNDKYLKVTPHTFRRSYKSRKAEEGADPRAIATNMGHKSLKTSEIYNVVDEERQSNVAGFFDEINPKVEKALVSLLEISKKNNINLSELQSQLRKTWSKKLR